jgi:hypothetical protein
VREQTATTIPRLRVRPEVIGIAQPLVVDYRKEEQTITAWVLKPHDVTQEVVSMICEPVKVTDPVTGECRIEEKQTPVVKKVTIQVWAVEPEERKVTIEVPYLKPGPVELVRKLTLHHTMEPAIEIRMRLDTTPGTLVVPPAPCEHGSCPAPIVPE